jgi:hypothetical protein
MNAAVYFDDQSSNGVTVLWLKWWAESDDTSDSASIRNLYLFVIITIVNVTLYFIYLASVILPAAVLLMLIAKAGISSSGLLPN